ncbi:MAG: hypothetical protein ACQESF_00090 [Nanobdellota archaeon]
MEKTILCHDPFKHKIDDYDRVYIGNEFCENLIDTEETLKKKIEYVLDKNKNFSFVTPYVTEKGLEKLKKRFTFLDSEFNDTEVIINDFGVLDLVSDFKNITPVLGRIIGNHLTKGLPDLRPNSNEALSFFKSKNIFRCEISNNSNTEKILCDDSLSYSIYFPYMFLSTGRRCMVGFDNKKVDENFDPQSCGKKCKKDYYIITHKQIEEKIIVIGNTHFIKENKLPDLSCFSRTVYMPKNFFS